jgi:hypothetical protein
VITFKKTAEHIEIPFMRRSSVNSLDAAAVVIPTFRSELTAPERISLMRCVEVLGRHPIFFIAPKGMALAEEVRAVKTARVIRFHTGFFAGIAGYNRLMLSTSFYTHFLAFQYILIYQLDAFVFQDALTEWCERGYDYVGSPWPKGDEGTIWAARQCSLVRRALARLGVQPRSWVGNGGFSLRNVRSSLLALRLLAFGVRLWEGNEDVFWSFYVRSYLPWFRIPTTEVALSFGFERDPERCFIEKDGKLPFGCHKWEMYGQEFWQEIFAGLNGSP